MENFVVQREREKKKKRRPSISTRQNVPAASSGRVGSLPEELGDDQRSKHCRNRRLSSSPRSFRAGLQQFRRFLGLGRQEAPSSFARPASSDLRGPRVLLGTSSFRLLAAPRAAPSLVAPPALANPVTAAMRQPVSHQPQVGRLETETTLLRRLRIVCPRPLEPATDHHVGRKRWLLPTRNLARRPPMATAVEETATSANARVEGKGRRSRPLVSSYSSSQEPRLIMFTPPRTNQSSTEVGSNVSNTVEKAFHS